MLCEIPYRNDAAHQTLVCVFVEHQTQTDWLVPLKTLIYAVLYWEWQWRPHEKAPTPRPTLEFTPLIPIVLFTGPRPWGSTRQLRDLFTGPPDVIRHVPDWQPVFWELAGHTTDEILQQPCS